MKAVMKVALGLISGLVMGLFASPNAFALPDANETLVTVRKNCGDPAPSNCFATLNAANTWVRGTASPSPAKRVTIDIGPGTWNESYTCAEANGDLGYVTLRGSGREATVLAGYGESSSTFHGSGCHGIEVKDLTITSEGWAVHWNHEGSSTWTNVDIIGLATGDKPNNGAWYDDYCYGTEIMDELPEHYFFGSRLTVHNRPGAQEAGAYWGGCSNTWFFGGEISYFSAAGSVTRDAAVTVRANSKFRAYGSLIRAVVTGDNPTMRGSLVAVDVNDLDQTGGAFIDSAPGQFHMHGGIINVTIDPATQLVGRYADATAVWTRGAGALSHTLDTAFVMKTPDNIPSYRVYTNSGGVSQTPLLWQSGPRPPMSSTEDNKIISEDGQDLFVETDCKANGDCISGDGKEAHLMVYNNSVCTEPANPWLDTATGRCRNVIETPLPEVLASFEARLTALELLPAQIAGHEAQVVALESQVGDLDARVEALENAP